MTLLEMTLAAPGFKAFCRRRINGRSLNHAQRYAAARKVQQSKIRAFCKRRGPLSVLLGDDMTRRGHGAGVYPIGNGEYARIFVKAGEFQSELINPPAASAESISCHTGIPLASVALSRDADEIAA